MTTTTQDESWRTVDAVRLEVADLLDDLTPEQRRHPSLCAAWSVRDVGAHLSMAALAPPAFVAWQAARQGFRFDPMIRESTLAWSRRMADDREVSATLRGIVGRRTLAPSTTWRDPLVDALVHGHDIADPLGIRVTDHVEAAATAADHVWTRFPLGFPFLPGRRLRGLRLVATDVEWSRGEGEEVRAPVTSLLLLSTGRRTSYADLEGPGADRARSLAAA